MKKFRDPVSSADQLFLLPPSVSEFVPPDSPARLLSEIIDSLDCSPLVNRPFGAGAPSYDPRLLFKVLVFGYWQGLRSSRKLEAALTYDMRYMFLAQMIKPDYRTISRFRVENEKAIAALFVETVILCQKLGLVLLEHVAVDGTKIEANVSGQQTLSTKRLEEAIVTTEAAIAQVLAEAKECDVREDAEHKDDHKNDPPTGLQNLEHRKEMLKKAKAELESEKNISVVAATDLESRVMRIDGRNRPCYNAQAVVDSKRQVIVAAVVTNHCTDEKLLEPMMAMLIQNTARKPAIVTADGGYWSPDTGEYAKESGIDAYVSVQPLKQRHEITYDQANDQFLDNDNDIFEYQRSRMQRNVTYKIYRSKLTKREHWVRQDNGRIEEMRAKISSPEGKATYHKRKQIVEPVFAHIKGPMNLRRLLLRGMKGASSEYLLACCAHNIQKIMLIWREQPI